MGQQDAGGHEADRRLVRHLTPPILETARLRLRWPRPDDLLAYVDLWADSTIVAWISGEPRSRQDCWVRLLRNIGHWHALGFGFWMIEDRASGALIGEAGLMEFERMLDPPPPPVPECGWLLASSAHGRGLGTEAVLAALAWMERERGSGAAFCMISPDNEPSLRVAEKAGFAEASEASYGRRAVTILRR